MTRTQAIQALSPIAAEQGGLISTGQVRLAGVDRHLVAGLTDAGYVQRLRRGVYAFGAGHAPDRFEDIASAWLAVDGRRLPWERRDAPEALVSHASAAQLHAIGTIIPTLPELTEQRQRTRRSDIIVHVARFTAEDWEWRRLGSGMRLAVTTPARTIVDLLLAGEELDYLQRGVRDAFADPEVARQRLAAALDRRRKPNAKQRRWAEQTIVQLTEPWNGTR